MQSRGGRRFHALALDAADADTSEIGKISMGRRTCLTLEVVVMVGAFHALETASTSKIDKTFISCEFCPE